MARPNFELNNLPLPKDIIQCITKYIFQEADLIKKLTDVILNNKYNVSGSQRIQIMANEMRKFIQDSVGFYRPITYGFNSSGNFTNLQTVYTIKAAKVEYDAGGLPVAWIYPDGTKIDINGAQTTEALPTILELEDNKILHLLRLSEGSEIHPDNDPSNWQNLAFIEVVDSITPLTTHTELWEYSYGTKAIDAEAALTGGTVNSQKVFPTSTTTGQFLGNWRYVTDIGAVDFAGTIKAQDVTASINSSNATQYGDIIRQINGLLTTPLTDLTPYPNTSKGLADILALYIGQQSAASLTSVANDVVFQNNVDINGTLTLKNLDDLQVNGKSFANEILSKLININFKASIYLENVPADSTAAIAYNYKAKTPLIKMPVTHDTLKPSDIKNGTIVFGGMTWTAEDLVFFDVNKAITTSDEVKYVGIDEDVDGILQIEDVWFTDVNSANPSGIHFSANSIGKDSTTTTPGTSVTQIKSVGSFNDIPTDGSEVDILYIVTDMAGYPEFSSNEKGFYYKNQAGTEFVTKTWTEIQKALQLSDAAFVLMHEELRNKLGFNDEATTTILDPAIYGIVDHNAKTITYPNIPKEHDPTHPFAGLEICPKVFNSKNGEYKSFKDINDIEKETYVEFTDGTTVQTQLIHNTELNQLSTWDLSIAFDSNEYTSTFKWLSGEWKPGWTNNDFVLRELAVKNKGKDVMERVADLEKGTTSSIFKGIFADLPALKAAYPEDSNLTDGLLAAIGTDYYHSLNNVWGLYDWDDIDQTTPVYKWMVAELFTDRFTPLEEWINLIDNDKISYSLRTGNTYAPTTKEYGLSSNFSALLGNNRWTSTLYNVKSLASSLTGYSMTWLDDSSYTNKLMELGLLYDTHGGNYKMVYVKNNRTDNSQPSITVFYDSVHKVYKIAEKVVGTDTVSHMYTQTTGTAPVAETQVTTKETLRHWNPQANSGDGAIENVEFFVLTIPEANMDSRPEIIYVKEDNSKQWDGIKYLSLDLAVKLDQYNDFVDGFDKQIFQEVGIIKNSLSTFRRLANADPTTPPTLAEVDAFIAGNPNWSATVTMEQGTVDFLQARNNEARIYNITGAKPEKVVTVNTFGRNPADGVYGPVFAELDYLQNDSLTGVPPLQKLSFGKDALIKAQEVSDRLDNLEALLPENIVDLNVDIPQDGTTGNNRPIEIDLSARPKWAGFTFTAGNHIEVSLIKNPTLHTQTRQYDLVIGTPKTNVEIHSEGSQSLIGTALIDTSGKFTFTQTNTTTIWTNNVQGSFKSLKPVDLSNYVLKSSLGWKEITGTKDEFDPAHVATHGNLNGAKVRLTTTGHGVLSGVIQQADGSTGAYYMTCISNDATPLIIYTELTTGSGALVPIVHKIVDGTVDSTINIAITKIEINTGGIE